MRWEMAAPGTDAKIALRASALTGRAGYLRRDAASGFADLVVREFTPDPAGHYVDALWTPPHQTGWAFQACCVREGAERFNELEYHAPADVRPSSDTSQVWAFRGPGEAVTAAAHALLGHCAENRAHEKTVSTS